MGCKNSPPSRTLAAYLVDQMPDEDVPKMCSVLAHMEHQRQFNLKGNP